MTKETEIVLEALEQLNKNTGIDGRWHSHQNEIDGELDLYIEGERYTALVEVKREIRQYQLSEIFEKARRYEHFIVVAEHIFPKIKEQLREQKIAYLDMAGNVFIKDDGRYLWIDGKKVASKKRKITNRAFTKTGLKAVFFLLNNPEAVNLTYKELSDYTNVAVGNVHNILKGLQEAGFILQVNKNEKRLIKKNALLKRWIDGYRETLKPSLHLGNFRFWNRDNFHDWNNLDMPESVIAKWSGEAAAEILTNYLNPETLTLYTDNRSPLVTKWKLIPDNEGAVALYKKFWGNEHEESSRYAPPLLVYADLIITENPRCIETAEMIYNKYLKDEFGND